MRQGLGHSRVLKRHASAHHLFISSMLKPWSAKNVVQSGWRPKIAAPAPSRVLAHGFRPVTRVPSRARRTSAQRRTCRCSHRPGHRQARRLAKFRPGKSRNDRAIFLKPSPPSVLTQTVGHPPLTLLQRVVVGAAAVHCLPTHRVQLGLLARNEIRDLYHVALFPS